MNIEVINQPKNEPITLEEVKSYLNIAHAYEDDRLIQLIMGSREIAERYTGRAFIEQTLCVKTSLNLPHSPHKKASGFPYKILSGRLATRLPRPPLRHVEQVQLINAQESKDIPAEKWHINTAYDPAVLIIDCEHKSYEQLQVTFQAGYGKKAKDIPAGLKKALFALIAHQYQQGDQDITPCLKLFDVYRLKNL